MAKQESWVGGLIVGAVLGMAAGMLLAPRSGKEMRKLIRKRGEQAWDDAATSLANIRDQLSAGIDDLKEAAKDLAGEAKEESQELIKRAEVLKSDIVSSAKGLARKTGQAREAAVGDVKRLVDEGADVMGELERLTRRLVGSTKGKLSRDSRA